MEEHLRTHVKPLRNGGKLTVENVPTLLDPGEPDFRAFTLDTARRLNHLAGHLDDTRPGENVRVRYDQLLHDAIQSDLAAAGRVELEYVPLPPQPQLGPDPVSLELRRATQERRLSGRELAARLNVKPPVVSRWLSPNYHGHSMDALRRLAEALDMELEVKLKPREERPV